MKSLEQRLKDEQDFHNHIFENQERAKVKNYYSINESITRKFESLLFENPKNCVILEYGCGMGDTLFKLAKQGALTHGIDISTYAIEQLSGKAAEQGLQTNYQVMNAEEMTFSDNFFDLIYGTGILHHLDLNRSFESVARILKPGGKAVFIEPLGHNPLINRFRNKTPSIRTEDEHPLMMNDFNIAKKYFNKVEVAYYYLATLSLPVLFGDSVPRFLVNLFDGIDKALFTCMPFLRKYSWQVLVILSEPGKPESR